MTVRSRHIRRAGGAIIPSIQTRVRRLLIYTRLSTICLRGSSRATGAQCVRHWWSVPATQGSTKTCREQRSCVHNERVTDGRFCPILRGTPLNMAGGRVGRLDHWVHTHYTTHTHTTHTHTHTLQRQHTDQRDVT